MTTKGRLDAAYRAESWQRMRAGVDVLVVGGGVTGAGVALDAAWRWARRPTKRAKAPSSASTRPDAPVAADA